MDNITGKDVREMNQNELDTFIAEMEKRNGWLGNNTNILNEQYKLAKEEYEAFKDEVDNNYYVLTKKEKEEALAEAQKQYDDYVNEIAEVMGIIIDTREEIRSLSLKALDRQYNPPTKEF